MRNVLPRARRLRLLFPLAPDDHQARDILPYYSHSTVADSEAYPNRQKQDSFPFQVSHDQQTYRGSDTVDQSGDIHQLEYELRRKNPDLLDRLRFALDDRKYGVLLWLLAQGAFWTAAILCAPVLMSPLVAGRAIIRSRLKQIERRDMGLKPRYPLRPDDRY